MLPATGPKSRAADGPPKSRAADGPSNSRGADGPSNSRGEGETSNSRARGETSDFPAAPGTDRPYTRLVVAREGPVGWLVFDRPTRGNAMDAAMLDELEFAWRELDADPEVRVIVNTGNGAAFQTGLDVAQLARDPAALREQSRRTKRSELRLTGHHNKVAKPVIAAVNGMCAGGGLHFVADADIVIASSDAVFLDPHVTVGQVSASEAITLAARMPFEPVMRMVLAGRRERLLTAERAHRLGMVSQVVAPPDGLRDAARELASLIARQPPELLAATKRALWNALEHPGRTSPWHTPSSNT